MPSVSKQQQKFFGLVRALQKGDVSPSSVTKKARDAAKDMKKSDVKKYAATKHKGLPRKVKGETKVKNLIKKMVREILDEVQLDEKCQPGYMTHPTRKTKKMFGKTYRNCVKKENTAPNHDGKAAPFGSGYKKAKNLSKILKNLNEKLSKSEIKKMRDKFDKTGKLPPHLMKLAKLMDKHTEVRNIVVPGLEWMSKLGEGKITEAVKFSSSQINQLVKAFKNVKGDVLPKNHPLMTQVTKLLKQTDKKTLQQIKSADIPYLSVIALDLLNEAKLTEKIKPKQKISKKEWSKIKKFNKHIGEDGTHYVMQLTNKGTALVPVVVEEKLSEQITSFNAIQDKLVDLGFGDMKISWKGTKKKIKDFKPGKRLDNITLEKTHNTLLKKNLIRYDGNSYNVTVNGQKNFKSTLQLEGKLTEAIQPSKAITKVLDMADGGYGKLGGKLVDGLSANLFKTVYNKANDTNKEKMNKMNEKQLYVFLTKLWSKFGRQVKI